VKNRTLVDRALEKAAKCEALGDIKGAKKWLAIANRAEKLYDSIDQSKKSSK